MTATLISADCVQGTRIRDLTSTGAGILCDTPVARGADVILKRGDLFIAARVAWTDGQNAGLEFYRSLPATDLFMDCAE